MLIIKDKTLLLKMNMAPAAPPGQKHPHPLAVSIYLWQLTFESSFLQTPCLLALMTPFMSCFPPASLTSSLLFLCIPDKLMIAWISAPTLCRISSVALGSRSLQRLWSPSVN